MPFKTSTKSEKKCCFLLSKLSQNDFFHIRIFHRQLVSQKLNSKLDFFEISFSLKYVYSKNFVFKNHPKRKIFNSKSDLLKNFPVKISFSRKKLLHSLIFFSKEPHFKHWFSMKRFASESCFLKKARNVEIRLLSVKQVESKRFFSHMNFSSKSCFSKIEFKTWFFRN